MTCRNCRQKDKSFLDVGERYRCPDCLQIWEADGYGVWTVEDIWVEI